MNDREQIKFGADQRPETEEKKEAPVVQESPKFIRDRMQAQAATEVASFQKECTQRLEAAQTRAASEELAIDDGDKDELSALNQDVENAQNEFTKDLKEYPQTQPETEERSPQIPSPIPPADSVKSNIEKPPKDYAGITRAKDKEINESKQRKAIEFQELQKKHEEAEKRLFGLGKIFGRKQRKGEIEDLLGEINFLEESDKENLRQAWNNFAEIQEDANRRELLLRNGSITKDEAQTAPDDLIWNKLLELAKRVERDAEEAQKINRGISEGILDISEAQSPQAKELLDQREEEILSHHYEERGSGDQEKKDKLNWNHLAFIRRTDVLPIFDPESGRVYVHRPITDIKDYFNPHFARPTTHWGLQEPASNPGMGEGKYGTDYIVFTNGKKMVKENGKPLNLFAQDTYWTHDLVLPQGSVIFTKNVVDTQIITLYKKAGVEIITIPEKQDLNRTVEEFSSKEGYNLSLAEPGYDYDAVMEFANENRLRYGKQEGDESEETVQRIAKIISLIKFNNTDDLSRDDRWYIKNFYRDRLKKDGLGSDQNIEEQVKTVDIEEAQEIKPWLKKEIIIQYQDLLSFLRSRQHLAIFQEQLQKVESLMDPVIEKL